MSIKTATLCAIIGLSTTFLIRTANTLFPTLYHAYSSAVGVSLVLLIAQMLVLIFFISIWRLFSRQGRETLAVAAMVGSIGQIINILLQLRMIQMITGIGDIQSDWLDKIMMYGMVIPSIASWWFFFVIYRRMRNVLGATGGALLGASLYVILAHLSFFFQKGTISFQKIYNVFPQFLNLMLLMGVIAFSSLISFFILLYRDSEKIEDKI